MNIVFDFGAVLFTWQPAQLLTQHFPQLANTPAAARELAQAIFHHEDWQDFDRGTVELPAVVAATAKRMAMPHDELHAMLAPIGERLAPIDCNIALLSALKERRDRDGDIKLYYLSNMPVPFARTLEQKHDFVSWFDGGVFSGDVKLGKPDPAIYQVLADRHSLVPERTVFIDDMPVNVKAAQDLGWHAIHCHDASLVASQLEAVMRAAP
jgi:putative hydrolase of the HAD superfamily